MRELCTCTVPSTHKFRLVLRVECEPSASRVRVPIIERGVLDMSAIASFTRIPIYGIATCTDDYVSFIVNIYGPAVLL